MSAVHKLITDHLDIWTAADTEKKSGRGRVSGNANSVYGIKKLRDLILELAVRGKLVPQDPNDEPASELLKRIGAEQTKLIIEGKVKKTKPLSEIVPDELPFSLPENWGWSRLGTIGYTQTGGTPSKSVPDFFGEDYPFIKPGDIYANYVDYGNEGLSALGAEKLGRIAPANSLLMVCIGTIGKCNVIEQDCVFNQQINSITPYLFNSRFLLTVCRSQYFNNEAWARSSSTTIAILNKGNWEEIYVPIPPLEEQHRIVAKVDELMALCDQLEAQHNNAANAHEQLVSHLLSTLTQSQDAEDFNANWQRIATHFDTLFTTESSIDALKQTLLQLAVMGKLVKQDPNDEPASELLKRIQAEKARLVAEGKIKKEKPLAAIRENEKPDTLPTGWLWVRLNELLKKIGAGSTPLGGKQVYVNEGIPFLRSQNVWDDGLRLNDVAFIEPSTHLKMYGTHVFAGDLLFNITGASIGRCAIVHDNFKTGNVSQHVTILRPISKNILRFLHLVLISKHVQKTVMDVQVGVSREGLSIGKLGQFVIPFPPIDEQHRIVSKVDELMKICDQLKSRINRANQVQKLIADVLIEEAAA